MNAAHALKSVRPDPASQRYVDVVNANSGGSARFDADALRAATPDADFDVIAPTAPELEAAFDKAFSEKPSAVMVVGGDGTARTAAVRAVATGVPIIPMPGGTMNVLPKIVFGHGDMARAIAEIPKLQPRSLDVGRVGGEPFFLAAAFGFAGPMTRLREATRCRGCRRSRRSGVRPSPWRTRALRRGNPRARRLARWRRARWRARTAPHPIRTRAGRCRGSERPTA